MKRKNIVLVSVVALAVVIFAIPELLSLIPGWPGYGIRSFIRWNDSVIVITHVRIIDGTGAPPLENAMVVIADGKIHSVGVSPEVSIPRNATILDFSGYTVIPGLVGMHDHLFYPVRGGAGGYQEMGFSFPRLYLANGVTTIRLAGSAEPDLDERLKNQIDRGWLAGPKIHLSGPYLNGWISPEQARNTVNEWADRGAGAVPAGDQPRDQAGVRAGGGDEEDDGDHGCSGHGSG